MRPVIPHLALLAVKTHQPQKSYKTFDAMQPFVNLQIANAKCVALSGGGWARRVEAAGGGGFEQPPGQQNPLAAKSSTQ